MMVWGVVWVRTLIRTDRKPSPLESELATVCELVGASQQLPPEAGENPERIGHFVAHLARGDLQLPDAMYNVLNTREAREQLVHEGYVPMHPDMVALLKGEYDRKNSSGSAAVTDLSCYYVKVYDLLPNTMIDSGYREGGAKRLLACFPLESAEAANLSNLDLSYPVMRRLLIDGKLRFLPFFGNTMAEDATVLTVSAMQGSSAMNIVHIVLKRSPFESNRGLYTAITRAIGIYVALGSRQAFDAAAQKAEPERRSALAAVLRQIQRHFEAEFPALDYARAAALELQEIQRRRKYFDHLTEHPKKFITPFAAQTGRTMAEAEAVLTELLANPPPQEEQAPAAPATPTRCCVEEADAGLEASMDGQFGDDPVGEAPLTWEEAYRLLLGRQLSAGSKA